MPIPFILNPLANEAAYRSYRSSALPLPDGIHSETSGRRRSALSQAVKGVSAGVYIDAVSSP